MTPRQFERLTDRLSEVTNTDDLFDLEVRFAPFDEDDATAVHALYLLACTRCQLASGPALAWDGFRVARPAPSHARDRFEIRGRIGTRIARVGWADGALFGSLYALGRLESTHASDDDRDVALHRIRNVFDTILEEHATTPRLRILPAARVIETADGRAAATSNGAGGAAWAALDRSGSVEAEPARRYT